MPPKGGKKKKKKTKEELEAERQAWEEEQERIRQEELAQQEAERKRREEAEAAAVEEAGRKRAIELGRLQEEMEEDQKEMGEWQARWEEERAKADGNQDWDQFLECDPRPDASSEPSLRMFLAELEDVDKGTEAQAEADSGDPISSTLERINRTDEVDRLVEEQLALAEETQDIRAKEQAEFFLSELRNGMHNCADRLAAWILENRHRFKTEVRAEQWEMRTAVVADGIQMGLWANLTGKQIRLGRMDIPEMDAHVSVPRQVCTTKPPVAVRLTYSRFNHVSAVAARAEKFAKEHRLSPPPCSHFAVSQQQRSRSRSRARPSMAPTSRPLVGTQSSEIAPEATESKDEKEEGEAEEEEGDGGVAVEEEEEQESRPATEASEQKDKEAEEEQDEAAATGKEEDEEALGSASAADDTVRQASRDLPRTAPEQVPLGGVYYVELVTLPTTGKTVKRWAIQRISPLSKGVERRAHPLEGQGMAAALTVRVQLSPTVILPDTLSVCFWDASLDRWQAEEDAQVTLEADTRTLAFKTTRMTAMALVQPRTIDLPYRRWWVQPDAGDTVLFGITTARFEVQLRVHSNGQVSLEAPEREELSHLRNVPYRPGRLLRLLAEAGIQMMPRSEDAFTEGLDVPMPGTASANETAPLRPKDAALEETIYRQMAHVAPAFAMMHSRWNQNPQWGWVDERKRGRTGDETRLKAIVQEPIAPAEESVVFRVREALVVDDFVPDVHPTDWRCAYVRRDDKAPNDMRISLVQTTEDSAVFHPEASAGGTTHNRLIKAVEPRATPEAVSLCQEGTSPILQDAVFRVLHLIRPLSFS